MKASNPTWDMTSPIRGAFSLALAAYAAFWAALCLAFYLILEVTAGWSPFPEFGDAAAFILSWRYWAQGVESGVADVDYVRAALSPGLSFAPFYWIAGEVHGARLYEAAAAAAWPPALVYLARLYSVDRRRVAFVAAGGVAMAFSGLGLGPPLIALSMGVVGLRWILERRGLAVAVIAAPMVSVSPPGAVAAFAAWGFAWLAVREWRVAAFIALGAASSVALYLAQPVTSDHKAVLDYCGVIIRWRAVAIAPLIIGGLAVIGVMRPNLLPWTSLGFFVVISMLVNAAVTINAFEWGTVFVKINIINTGLMFVLLGTQAPVWEAGRFGRAAAWIGVVAGVGFMAASAGYGWETKWSTPPDPPPMEARLAYMLEHPTAGYHQRDVLAAKVLTDEEFALRPNVCTYEDGKRSNWQGHEWERGG